MNLRGLVKKLQTALLQKGVVVKINQVQFYAAEQKRMVTKFLVIRQETVSGHRKNVTILETCSIVEVVKRLADLLGGG